MRNLNPNLMTNVRGLWQFEGDLTEEISSLSLTASSGSDRYSVIRDLQGVYLQSGIELDRPSNDASLTLLGPLTIHMVVCLQSIADSTLLSFSGAGETEAENILYELGITSGSWEYRFESGSGVDTTFSFAAGPVLGAWHLVSLVRSTLGDVIFYVDGEAVGNISSGLGAPTGGGSSFLQVGGFEGYLGGLSISEEDTSPERVRAQWSHSNSSMSSHSFQGLDGSLVSGVVADYSFDGDLTDQSGNSLDLSWTGSTLHTPRFAHIKGVPCVFNDRDVDNFLERPSHDAILAITSDLTIHILVLVFQKKMGKSFVRFVGQPSGVSAENETENFLYEVTMFDSNPRRLVYFSENGAGNNSQLDTNMTIPRGTWNLITLTRSSSGFVRFYFNGEEAWNGSTTLPTGGSNARLKMGLTNSSRAPVFYGGLIIANQEATRKEVEQQWLHVIKGADRPETPTEVRRRFLMRGFDSGSGKYVTWQANFKDTAGAKAPIASLSDIQLVGVSVR